jgi:Axonemal dynein light chain
VTALEIAVRLVYESMTLLNDTYFCPSGDKALLELEVQELRSKLEIIEKREAERKAADEKRRKEELDFLKYQGQHLDTFLKQMNASK